MPYNDPGRLWRCAPSNCPAVGSLKHGKKESSMNERETLSRVMVQMNTLNLPTAGPWSTLTFFFVHSTGAMQVDSFIAQAKKLVAHNTSLKINNK